MHKSIFLPFTSYGEQSGALAFAASLAGAFDGAATGVFSSKSLTLLDAALRSKVGKEALESGYAAAEDLSDTLYEQQHKDRAKEAGAWFEAEKAKLAEGSRLKLGKPFELFESAADQARDECAYHDITVASFDLGLSIYDDVVEGALFATGRPLALIRQFEPDRKLSGLTITLAFKPSPPMLHAQWHALPLLKLAKRVLLAFAPEGAAPSRDSVSRFKAYLGEHGVKAEIHTLAGGNDAAAEMESFHLAQNADLLVMGAYSHSRLRQLVFGGFTEHFLDRKTCNLFLSH
jgi:nucleotide-binding universal stress UspA family protein